MLRPLVICSALAWIATVAAWPVNAQGAAPDASATTDQQREYFERRVRPLLVEHCQGCHGPDKQKGGLRVDSRAALLTGGDSGPAVVPGKPDEGHLVSAINYGELYQMPPKGKLKADDIAALTQWVRDGAWWPAEVAAAAKAKPDDDWAERAKYWSFQPIAQPEVPQVNNTDWCQTPIDRFIMAKLEQASLKPAAPAERSAWLRRVTFALTGLPPTAAEIAAFIADRAPDAEERVVDRLLGSLRFGERFARHWLDLTRYAETYGHEFDFDIPHAWRYRDYLIRAFNQDLPYDQFIREQVAGDLLTKPRRLTDGSNESVRGTGFYWFGEQTHSPVDLLQAEADRIDNQIDVLSKTFLGLTLACARCHDHKFDAIRAADYYAMFGMLQSSRFTQWDATPAEANQMVLRELAAIKPKLQQATVAAIRSQVAQLDKSLLAAVSVELNSSATSSSSIPPTPGDWRWQLSEARTAEHPLFPIASLIKANKTNDSAAIAAAWTAFTKREAQSARTGDEVLYDAASPLPAGWRTPGLAFANAAVKPGDFLLGNLSSQPVASVVVRPALNTANLSKRLQGSLQSPDFTITHKFIHVRLAGWQTRVRLVIDGFELIRSPIYGGLTRNVASDQPRWLTFDVDMWQGHRAYFEFNDLAPQDPADPLPSATTIALYGKVLAAETTIDNMYGGTGWLSLEHIVLSSESAPRNIALIPTLLGDEPPKSLEELAVRYRNAAVAALTAWEQNELGSSPVGGAQAELLDWLLGHTPAGKLADAKNAAAREAQSLWQRYREVEANLVKPQFVLAMTEGTAADAPIYIRGNPKNRGAKAPRQFVQAISHTTPIDLQQASGRLYLAERLTDVDNPLVARVIVNRLWRYMLGEGLVRSPDDFGHMGQTPSHAELLDWLARDFVAHGWSIKHTLRQIALSNVYRTGSLPNAQSIATDPDNKLWHHVPVKRLEAEAIRDAILAISGRLNETMYGPSVPTHLNDFMIGRGRPSASGPLDGDGRRSVYLSVRRNFLNPMFQAFDQPQPFSTVGRRSVSHVPAQALAMMNNPLVIEQAKLWGKHAEGAGTGDSAAKITDMYLAAFARRPTADELQAALAFVAPSTGDESKKAGTDAWADLAHALFNASEFVFVP